MLDRIRKPWFVHRPSQILRRFARALRAPSDPLQVVRLPWGLPIAVDTREAIGRSIWQIGIYDLAVTELLLRLIHPGDFVVDVGANIGYMTGVMGWAAGPSGEVWSLEPHPVLFQELTANVARFRQAGPFSSTSLLEVAASDRDGTSELVPGAHFDQNRGTARLGEQACGTSMPVGTVRLDSILSGRQAAVLKIDVEGHEAAVLRGASATLSNGSTQHVIFEEHGDSRAETFALLRGFGYSILQVGWAPAKLALVGLGAPPVHKAYEPANYLATRDASAATRACARTGWLSLRCRRDR